MKLVTIQIYSGPSCAACDRAKNRLARKLAGLRHVFIEEFDIKSDPARCAEMIARSGGRKTIPQIFIDGVHVGGSDDLAEWDSAGKLDAMLGIES